MRPKNTCVLYLLPDKLQLYVDSLTEIFDYHFQSESVKDLTIVNQELFEQDIATFILHHRIPSGNLLVIIANSAAHIQALKQEESTEAQIKTFLATVQIPHIISKTISTPNGQFIYAVNQNLCDGIKAAFEKQNFGVDFVLPALAFGDEFSSHKTLTFKDIATVLKQAFIKEQYDLIPTKMVPDKHELDEILKHETNKDIMRLYAAASIFGMVTIGIAVMWNVYNPYPQTYRGQAENTQRQIIMPAAQETNDLIVHVLYTPTSSPFAEELQTSLAKYKFKSLILSENTQPRTTATIIFGDKASPTVRGAILAEVQRYISEITVHEASQTDSDITIILP